MGRTKKDQFTDEECRTIWKNEGPLTTLWNLQSMMSYSEDGAEAFGQMVKEELPGLIDKLEASLEKTNEARRIFDLKAASDLTCRIADISDEIRAVGQLFSRWNEEECVRFDYDESNGMFRLLAGIAREVKQAGDDVENL